MINSIVAGNWKMNKTPSQGKSFSEIMVEKLDSKCSVDVIICPPFTGLSSLVSSSKFHLGAQNCHFENSGAGENHACHNSRQYSCFGSRGTTR